MSQILPNSKCKSMCQNDILAGLVSHGMTWPQARIAYKAFTEIIADAVVNGQRVRIGEVLTLDPEWKQPRTVAQNIKACKGGNNKTERTDRRIHLGVRLKYSVKLHSSFLNKRRINWF